MSSAYAVGTRAGSDNHLREIDSVISDIHDSQEGALAKPQMKPPRSTAYAEAISAPAGARHR